MKFDKENFYFSAGIVFIATIAIMICVYKIGYINGVESLIIK